LLLENNDAALNGVEITAEGVENTKRKVVLHKVAACYHLYKELISLYATQQIILFIENNNFKTWNEILSALPKKSIRNEWLNLGGQLMPTTIVQELKEKIKSGKIKSWDGIHTFYTSQSSLYPQQKLMHAIGALLEIEKMKLKVFDTAALVHLLNGAVNTKEWMAKGIYQSRAKDYNSSFRKMVYDNVEEMNNVMGALDKNSFIIEQQQALAQFKLRVTGIKKKLKLR
jgi:hypothetical protein